MTKKIIAKELDSELMLYDVDSDEVHILNAAAQLIYTLHQEGKNIAEIEEQIRARFQTKEDEDIRNNIQQCLDDLRQKELITSKNIAL